MCYSTCELYKSLLSIFTWWTTNMISQDVMYITVMTGECRGTCSSGRPYFTKMGLSHDSHITAHLNISLSDRRICTVGITVLPVLFESMFFTCCTKSALKMIMLNVKQIPCLGFTESAEQIRQWFSASSTSLSPRQLKSVFAFYYLSRVKIFLLVLFLKTEPTGWWKAL